MVIDITVLYFLLPIILEPFPISSSGHGMLLAHIFNLFNFVPLLTDFSSTISFVLHFPIALVLPLFFSSTLKRVALLLVAHSSLWWRYLIFGICAESVTLGGYLLFHSSGAQSSSYFLFSGFLITALLLAITHYMPLAPPPKLTWKEGCIMGLAQGCAFLPGISRLGATLCAGRVCGFSLKKAFELSCLIEWPISCVAGSIGMYRITTGGVPDLLRLKLQIAMVMGMPLAYGGYCIFYSMIKHRKIWWWSWYLMVVGVSGLCFVQLRG